MFFSPPPTHTHKSTTPVNPGLKSVILNFLPPLEACLNANHFAAEKRVIKSRLTCISFIANNTPEGIWFESQPMSRLFIFTAFKEIAECLETDHDRFLRHPNLTITHICAE
jgi:hypothetical protein